MENLNNANRIDPPCAKMPGATFYSSKLPLEIEYMPYVEFNLKVGGAQEAHNRVNEILQAGGVDFVRRIDGMRVIIYSRKKHGSVNTAGDVDWDVSDVRMERDDFSDRVNSALV